MNRFNLILIAFGFFTFSTFSQLSEKSQLKLEEIMKGNEFIGHQPENFQWNLNSDKIYFDWNKENNPLPSTYVFKLNEYNPILTKNNFYKIEQQERAKQVVNQSKFTTIFYSYQGGLWKHTKKTSSDQLVFKTTEPLTIIQRSSENTVFFQLGNNVYSYASASGSIRQLTDFKKEVNKSKEIDSSFIMKEEYNLFEITKTQAKLDVYRKKKQQKDTFQPKEIAIGSTNLENLQVANNGAFITFRLSDYPDEKPTEVAHYLAKNGQSFHENSRPKVALQQPTQQLGVYNLIKDTVYFLDFSKLKGIYEQPAYLKDTTAAKTRRKLALHS